MRTTGRRVWFCIRTTPRILVTRHRPGCRTTAIRRSEYETGLGMRGPFGEHGANQAKAVGAVRRIGRGRPRFLVPKFVLSVSLQVNPLALRSQRRNPALFLRRRKYGKPRPEETATSNGKSPRTHLQHLDRPEKRSSIANPRTEGQTRRAIDYPRLFEGVVWSIGGSRRITYADASSASQSGAASSIPYPPFALDARNSCLYAPVERATLRLDREPKFRACRSVPPMCGALTTSPLSP